MMSSIPIIRAQIAVKSLAIDLDGKESLATLLLQFLLRGRLHLRERQLCANAVRVTLTQKSMMNVSPRALLQLHHLIKRSRNAGLRRLVFSQEQIMINIDTDFTSAVLIETRASLVRSEIRLSYPRLQV